MSFLHLTLFSLPKTVSIWKESHLKNRKGKLNKTGPALWRGDNEKTEFFSFLFTEALK